MPKVKSQAQAGKMGALFSQGKISKGELSARTKGVKVGKLPERVGKKKAPPTKRGSGISFA